MNYTITANPAFNSIEISFDGKPAQEVRDALKALKFRWHSVKRVWYGYADEATARAAIDGGKVAENKPAERKPESKKAAVIDLTGIENNKKTAYGAEFAKILREDLKKRGASGVTIRCNRSGYTDSITATIKFSADDFRSAEECAARDGWSLFFRKQEANSLPDLCGVNYSPWNKGHESATRQYITCGSRYDDNSADSNAHVLRAFWLYQIKNFSVFTHHMDAKSHIALTSAAFERVAAIVSIIQSYNWDRSDSMTDYYDVGFYFDVDIKIPADFKPREFMTDAEREQLKKDLDAEEQAERERMEAWKREQEEAKKEQERREAQEAIDRAEIEKAVTVEDLPEDKQYYIFGLRGGIGKESTLDELRERADRDTDAYITRRLVFSNAAALDKFCNMLLHDFNFISGKGGTGTNDPRVTDANIMKLNTYQREQVKFYAVDCIAVYFDNVLQFVINPEGYNYARYCYIPTEGTREETPAASANLTAKEEAAQVEPFYFPASVVEQAAALPVGEVVTVYQTDGWILQNVCTTGILLSVERGNYAQYSGVYLTIQRGKKTARVFCYDGKETVVFPGLPLDLPDRVKYSEITSRTSGAVMYHCRDYGDEMRQIIAYYAEKSRKPALDTVQR